MEQRKSEKSASEKERPPEGLIMAEIYLGCVCLDCDDLTDKEIEEVFGEAA